MSLSTSEASQAWIKDGSATEAPVTASTPAPEAAAPAPATPAVEQAASGQPRDDHGRFAPVDAAAPAPAATEAVATPPAPGASAQDVVEYLEALVGDKPFQIPRNATIPLKRGSDIEQVSIADLQKRGMLEKDYREKTAAHAATVREFQRQSAVKSAEIEAREQRLREEQEMYDKAMTGTQEEFDQFQQYRNLMATNPAFKKNIEDSYLGRALQARDTALTQIEQQEVVQGATNDALGWIHQAAQAHGVEPEMIGKLYGDALTKGAAELNYAAVEAIAKQEAAKAGQATQPLRDEIAELKRQIEAIKTSGAQTAHNATTKQKIDRTTSPIGAPAGGGIVATGGKPLTQTGRKERSDEWARAGR